MQSACLLVWLTDVYPLWRAWQANRQTSLRQAVSWAIASWAGWGLALAGAARWPALMATASCYFALSLTGCAAVAVLGARRATKILGIFARLSRRDGKHQYLRHIPRVSRYLERNLEHPSLAPVKQWFDRHLPVSLRESEIA